MTANAHRLFAVLAGSLLVAACSSSDPVESDSSLLDNTVETTEAVPSSETPSTSPDTTENTTPSTEATTPSTAEATTTSTPTTISAGTPEEAVTAAVAFFEEQWKECLRTLPNCDEVKVLDRRAGDVSVEAGFTSALWNENDYRANRVDGLDYRVDEVTISDDGTTARAVVCVTDPVEITEADGSVVSATYLTGLQDFDLVLSDGEWTWTTRTIGETVEGEENSVCVL